MYRAKVVPLVIIGLVLLLALPLQAQERVQVRWLVGLGTGTSEAQIHGQQQIVDEFNASQTDIELVLEVIPTAEAYNVLSAQIAEGNPPDIVGPMGIYARSRFAGVWLDIEPLVAAVAYDLSDFEPSLIDFYRVEGQGLLSIPFLLSPQCLIYNIHWFDEAGLPYPPQSYGEPYLDWNGDERPWNLDTLRELAMRLTIDAYGNNATMEAFDPTQVVVYGFGNELTDFRGRNTLFGAGNLVDSEGNAIIPDHWQEAAHWYHQAMWEDYFHPNGISGSGDVLGGPGGNWFGSGNLAMALGHLWLLGWGTSSADAAWNIAPVPAYGEVTTAKLHADTFGILSATLHPEEAFTVLAYLTDDRAAELSQIYGGNIPARMSLREDAFAWLTEGLAASDDNIDWADFNWDVLIQALAYPDIPSHEGAMPNFLEAVARHNEFVRAADNNPDFAIDAELFRLQADLQQIFDAVAD